MRSDEIGDRYLLDEALTLYEFEPTLRDVYVEGKADVGFFIWYLGECGIEADVYAIDDRLYVTAAEVGPIAVDINARGRAITFAVHSERRLGKSQRSVTVVVDADASQAVGPVPIESSCLLCTDDGALECYTLQTRPFGKFLKVCLHEDVDPGLVLKAILPALGDIFAVRMLLHGFGVRIIEDIAGVCVLSEDESCADIRELILRSMSSVRREEWPCPIDDLEGFAKDYRAMVSKSSHVGRGHDIAPLVAAYFGTSGRLARRDVLEAALLGCLERKDVDDAPLFVALRERLSAA